MVLLANGASSPTTTAEPLLWQTARTPRRVRPHHWTSCVFPMRCTNADSDAADRGAQRRPGFDLHGAHARCAVGTRRLAAQCQSNASGPGRTEWHETLPECRRLAEWFGVELLVQRHLSHDPLVVIEVAADDTTACPTQRTDVQTPGMRRPSQWLWC